MLTRDQIKELYENELKPQLAGMEGKRKKIKKLRRFAIFSFVLGVVAFYLGSALPPWSFFSVLALFAAVGVFFVIKAFIRYMEYKKIFKSEVITKIVALINPEYHYDPNRCIPGNTFTNSKLFKRSYDRCGGDDFVWGRIEKTDFEFSELKAEYKTETTDKDGKKEVRWNTIFQGIFFYADFNKHIEGETFVLPDTSEKLLGKIAHKFQKESHRGELVKLENPEFEKVFKVFSSSQQEARYILTPVMMEVMTNVQKRVGRPMYFSFIGERVYCAVSMNKEMFEPKVSKNGISYRDIEEMFMFLSLIELIIHEMNLNTRIWTKE